MKQGEFVWYELVTTDPIAIQHFYADVVGWVIEDVLMPGMTYTLAKVGERQVAGMMGWLDEMGPPRPSWRGYIAVDDVDDMAVRLAQAGGTVHRAPSDIPEVGRFAVCSDPQGAMFMIFKGTGNPPAELSPHTRGNVGWHELVTGDWEAAFAFYSGLFGWTKGDTVDMGPMGKYQLFATGGEPIGGMMNDPAGGAPRWAYYVVVDDIQAAKDRMIAGGGTLIHGPHEVPGGAWVLQGVDPQGAHFALTAPV